MKRIVMLVISALALVTWAKSASAHAFIDHCTPGVGSTNAQTPKQVQCTFTAAVDPRQTVFAVYDAKRAQVDNKDLKSDPNDRDAKTVMVTLNAAKVTPGIYTVKWETVSEDGDKTDGQRQFSVGSQTAPSIVIVAPAAETNFAKAPSDITVTVNVSNLQLGQAGRRWQVYLDDKFATQVTTNSASTMLKGISKGDHVLKVTLATANDEKTIVATAGVAFTVGAQPTPTPTAKPKPVPTSTQVARVIPTSAPLQSPAPNVPSTPSDNFTTSLFAIAGGLVALLVVAGLGVFAFLRLRKRPPKQNLEGTPDSSDPG